MIGYPTNKENPSMYWLHNSRNADTLPLTRRRNEKANQTDVACCNIFIFVDKLSPCTILLNILVHILVHNTTNTGPSLITYST